MNKHTAHSLNPTESNFREFFWCSKTEILIYLDLTIIYICGIIRKHSILGFAYTYIRLLFPLRVESDCGLFSRSLFLIGFIVSCVNPSCYDPQRRSKRNAL